MKTSEAREFALALRRQRTALFKEVQDTEADLDFIAQDRESELEERAQEERDARLLVTLDERGKRELEDIDVALRRIEEGCYGVCMECGGEIPKARLNALPATSFCIQCAGSH